MTDPIADMLTRIRNANMVRHEDVRCPASRMKYAIAQVMKEEGFIHDVEWIKDDKQGVLRIILKYGPNNEKVITGLKRISTPGLRVYVKAKEIPPVLRGLGIGILSTNQGLMTDRGARKKRLGGEMVAWVW